jgi:hypothetical protein
MGLLDYLNAELANVTLGYLKRILFHVSLDYVETGLLHVLLSYVKGENGRASTFETPYINSCSRI